MIAAMTFRSLTTRLIFWTLLASGSVFDAPVYSWIQARQRRTQTYAFFLAEIPLGFARIGTQLKIGASVTLDLGSAKQEIGKIALPYFVILRLECRGRYLRKVRRQRGFFLHLSFIKISGLGFIPGY